MSDIQRELQSFGGWWHVSTLDFAYFLTFTKSVNLTRRRTPSCCPADETSSCACIESIAIGTSKSELVEVWQTGCGVGCGHRDEGEKVVEIVRQKARANIGLLVFRTEAQTPSQTPNSRLGSERKTYYKIDDAIIRFLMEKKYSIVFLFSLSNFQ